MLLSNIGLWLSIACCNVSLLDQYSPRFLWMWPNAKICVMGPDQLASVMQSVSGRGKSAEEQEKSFGELRGRIEKESSALYSTARIWVSPINISCIIRIALKQSG